MFDFTTQLPLLRENLPIAYPNLVQQINLMGMRVVNATNVMQILYSLPRSFSKNRFKLFQR